MEAGNQRSTGVTFALTLFVRSRSASATARRHTLKNTNSSRLNVGMFVETWRGIAGSMTEAGKYRGFDPDGIAETEADHFANCRRLS
jgi:hypothetical protein